MLRTKFMTNTKLNTNQSGFVAFFVSIMVMTIFGILILSFSEISNREGTSALDRNLSTSALYAAESGINDAYTVVSSGTGTMVNGTTPTDFNSLNNGAIQSYQVPTGVTSLQVYLYGAQGGSTTGYLGGLGGATTGIINNLIPGENLQIQIGQAGYNFGYVNYGGGGSFIFGNNNAILAAAGGGGASGSNGSGGNGGGVVGQSGGGTNGGTGGTQSAGGSPGGWSIYGAANNYPFGGFFGGGGYFGGGGSPSNGSGAGGGSSLIPNGGGSTISGVRSGNGEIVVIPVTTAPSSQTNSQTNQCTPSTFGTPKLSSNTSYSCVLVSNTPSTLKYQCPGFCPNDSFTSYLQSSVSNIDQLSINWSDPTKSNTGCSAQIIFYTATSWPSNCLEVLRVDLVPFSPGVSTLSNLESGVKTFFLYPQTSATGTLPFSSINEGSIYAANCPIGTSSCSFNITGLSPISSSYYARVQYYYGSSGGGPTISFSGKNFSGSSVSFSSSQLQIDSTGKSGTTLKRVSANIGFGNSLTATSASTYSLPIPPSFAIQSTHSICKSFLEFSYPIDNNGVLQSNDNIIEQFPATLPSDITQTPNSQLNANLGTSNPNTDYCNPL